MTAATWRRQLDPNASLFGRLAQLDGAAAGFTISVLHEGTWVVTPVCYIITPVCYMEDLFVDPAARGRGVGRALIDDLVAMARARGWSRLYWHTMGSNEAARRLYDNYAPSDDFVRYRLFLS